jgi:hypothetical protein
METLTSCRPLSKKPAPGDQEACLLFQDSKQFRAYPSQTRPRLPLAVPQVARTSKARPLQLVYSLVDLLVSHHSPATCPPTHPTTLTQAGFTSTSMSNPAFTAWVYDPEAPAGQRFQDWGTTNIARLYHSTALLLPDASILVAGSEYRG